MEIIINFTGGMKVDAVAGEFTIKTDQLAPHGEGSAPEPFTLFLASLGTCAGVYIMGFCRKRDLPTKGIRLVQENVFDKEKHRLTDVRLRIEVPKDFPEKYHDALIRSAEQCAVKRALADPPNIQVETSVV